MNSYSQFGQDLFVLSKLNNKHNGFFVEAGAYDGVESSNTYLLEKEYGWKGILCEPNDQLRQCAIKNREGPVEERVLWSRSDEQKEFVEAEALGGVPECFRTTGDPLEIQRFRSNGKRSIKKTISLNSMLEKHNAPRNIDYISLDTEGSEKEILSTFDFEKWNVLIWTIEINDNDGDINAETRADGIVPVTESASNKCRLKFGEFLCYMRLKGYNFHPVDSGHDAYFSKVYFRKGYC